MLKLGESKILRPLRQTAAGMLLTLGANNIAGCTPQAVEIHDATDSQKIDNQIEGLKKAIHRLEIEIGDTTKNRAAIKKLKMDLQKAQNTAEFHREVTRNDFYPRLVEACKNIDNSPSPIGESDPCFMLRPLKPQDLGLHERFLPDRLEDLIPNRPYNPPNQ